MYLELSQTPLMEYFENTLREKCPCSEFFWSVFSRIRIELILYSVRMR